MKDVKKDIKKFVFFVTTLQAIKCTYELLEALWKEIFLLLQVL
jgi:hypothetical protein